MSKLIPLYVPDYNPNPFLNEEEKSLGGGFSLYSLLDEKEEGDYDVSRELRHGVTTGSHPTSL